MRHTLQAEGFGVRLRPVRLEDAPFIVWLRNLEHVKGRVGDSAADAAGQEAWLRAYFERQGDYYFIIETGGGFAAIGAAVGLLAMFVLAGHPERIGRTLQRAERVLPPRLAHVVARLGRTFAEGLAVMRRPGPLVASLALSFPVWLSIATTIWLSARAFHITMPFAASFLVVAILAVGVSVPTPGAVGGFHYAFRVAATAFFGASNDRAVGAAIVLHAISFVPVAIVGAFFMFQDGLDFTRVRALAGEAEPLGPGAGDAPGGKGAAP